MVLFFQAEDGIRVLVRSRGLGDVYKRQAVECGVVGHRPEEKRLAGRQILHMQPAEPFGPSVGELSLIHISEPTRPY